MAMQRDAVQCAKAVGLVGVGGGELADLVALLPRLL